MNDKQQLAAMGEHMRDMEKCEQDASRGLVDALSAISADCGVPVSMLTGNSAADFKVPDGWKLVPLEATPEMRIAAENLAAEEYSLGVYADEVRDMYASMLAAAPEYKP